MIDADFIKKEFEKHKVAYWDCRYNKIISSGILLWNKELRQISESETEGVSIRVFDKNSWGFAATTKTDRESIRKTIRQAIKISNLISLKKKKSERKTPKEIFSSDLFKEIKDKKMIKGKKNIMDLDIREKKNLLLEQNYELKAPIKSVYLRYADRTEKKLFISSSKEIFQETDSVFLVGGVSAAEAGNTEEKMFKVSALGGFEALKNVQKELDKTIARSKKFLKAPHLKPGKWDVVMSGELTGVFVHEALGHASEADTVLHGASCLKGKLNKKIANPRVSVIDDPTQGNYREWGCYYYDDEGIKSKKNYIIKKGILNTYLHSLETSLKMKTAPTGNARAENALYKPIVRMSNTYVEKGDYSFKELIKKIKKGYFLRGFNGGATNPADGGFQFGVVDAYYVENGKIVNPVRGGAIGGHTLDILRKIKFVENKYSEKSDGFCGKDGQRVYSGGKNPAVFVEKAHLG